jgi:uncharacterized protein (TIGR00251 family)
MAWFRQDKDRLILSVHAQPGAKRTGIQGLHGEALTIRVAAPPVEGAANDELRRFLAQSFAVALRDVDLVSGLSSRAKRFEIRGSRVDPRTLCDVES